MEIRANISETVKQFMREKNKTLAELSEELNIPLSSMKNYVNGATNLRADTIEMLAEKFEMTPAELISPCPKELLHVQAAVRAAELFAALPPEQRQEGMELFLKMVDVFVAARKTDG